MLGRILFLAEADDGRELSSEAPAAPGRDLPKQGATRTSWVDVAQLLKRLELVK